MQVSNWQVIEHQIVANILPVPDEVLILKLFIVVLSVLLWHLVLGTFDSIAG